MRKYIDADELKKVFRYTEDAEYARWTLAGILGEIDDIEATNVAEVKHGRWIELQPFKNIFTCSLCGRWGEYHWNYCPHCGAKMDEVEETSNTTQYTECVINLYKETKLRFVLDEYIEDEELIEKILKALDDEK